MILKVYSFIYMQNKIIDLPKKALGDCREKDKIFLKVTDFFNFQSNIIQIIESRSIEVSITLTVNRKMTKKLTVRRKNRQILTVDHKKVN